MKNFVPRLINGVVLFAAGGLAVVTAEAVLIGKGVNMLRNNSDYVDRTVIPGVKDMICDGVEMIFFGGTREKRNSYPRYSRKPRIDYSAEYHFKDRAMAEDFVEEIVNFVETYGVANYADIKTIYTRITGIHDPYEIGDEKEGWTHLDICKTLITVLTARGGGTIVKLPASHKLRRSECRL